jgi:hypothetical protein
MKAMAMKAMVTILTAAVLPATSASAQFTFTPGPQQPSAFGVDPIIRVTTAFRTTVATEPQVVPDAKAQETAHRALYGMAESECANLSEIFKAECRLSSVQIIFPFVTPANAPPSNVMTTTCVYELKPKGSASGR